MPTFPRKSNPGLSRHNPIERHYFELVMADGRIRTVYHDRRQDEWFEQRG